MLRSPATRHTSSPALSSSASSMATAGRNEVRRPRNEVRQEKRSSPLLRELGFAARYTGTRNHAPVPLKAACQIPILFAGSTGPNPTLSLRPVRFCDRRRDLRVRRRNIAGRRRGLSRKDRKRRGHMLGGPPAVNTTPHTQRCHVFEGRAGRTRLSAVHTHQWERAQGNGGGTVEGCTARWRKAVRRGVARQRGADGQLHRPPARLEREVHGDALSVRCS